MKFKNIALTFAAAVSLSACIVAPPHMRYAQQQSVVSEQPTPGYAPAPVYSQPPIVYIQPAPPVYYNPWFVPNIGLNFWWGRQWGGHGHRR